MSLKTLTALQARLAQTPDGTAERAAVAFLLDVHQRMDELGMSHVDLAQRLGTSRSYITRLFVGRANLSVQTLSRLAAALGGVVRLQLELNPTDAEQVS
jgi:plasmid maintenance system antidote protein VapI